MGEGQRRQNFQGYHVQFTDYFVTLANSVDPYDKAKKVHLFLADIKHEKLSVTVAVIQAYPLYRNNFQNAADLLLDAVIQQSSDPVNA